MKKPSYSRLDILSGETRHPGNVKIKSIVEDSYYNCYDVRVSYPGKVEEGLFFVDKSETDDIISYLKEMVECPLLDLSPVGEFVSFTTLDGVKHIGFCTGADSFRYVVKTRREMRYVTEVKIL